MDLTRRLLVIEVIDQPPVAVQRLGAYAGMRRHYRVIGKFRNEVLRRLPRNRFLTAISSLPRVRNTPEPLSCNLPQTWPTQAVQDVARVDRRQLGVAPPERAQRSRSDRHETDPLIIRVRCTPREREQAGSGTG